VVEVIYLEFKEPDALTRLERSIMATYQLFEDLHAGSIRVPLVKENERVIAALRLFPPSDEYNDQILENASDASGPTFYNKILEILVPSYASTDI
jgi:hypothetical protein